MNHFNGPSTKHSVQLVRSIAKPRVFVVGMVDNWSFCNLKKLSWTQYSSNRLTQFNSGHCRHGTAKNGVFRHFCLDELEQLLLGVIWVLALFVALVDQIVLAWNNEMVTSVPCLIGNSLDTAYLFLNLLFMNKKNTLVHFKRRPGLSSTFKLLLISQYENI